MLCYFVCERKVFVEQAVKRICCKLAGELRCECKHMVREVVKGKSVRNILTQDKTLFGFFCFQEVQENVMKSYINAMLV